MNKNIRICYHRRSSWRCSATSIEGIFDTDVVRRSFSAWAGRHQIFGFDEINVEVDLINWYIISVYFIFIGGYGSDNVVCLRFTLFSLILIPSTSITPAFFEENEQKYDADTTNGDLSLGLGSQFDVFHIQRSRMGCVDCWTLRVSRNSRIWCLNSWNSWYFRIRWAESVRVQVNEGDQSEWEKENSQKFELHIIVLYLIRMLWWFLPVI